MERRELAHLRLINQQIATTRAEKPCDVVASLGAMQAQDYLGALWAIALRRPGTTERDIEQTIADRAIVRTWPMRGTLHFVAAADVVWMLELLTPRIVAGSAGRLRELELDETTVARSREVIGQALEGGRQLARPAVFATLEGAGISTAGQRGYHILGQLAQTGFLCFGVHEGKQPSFVLLHEWVPHARRLDRQAALAELALRYFTGHGPATLRDFAWWSGLTLADARAGLSAVSTQLTQAVVDAETYWMPLEMPEHVEDAAGVHLLPGFDEYMLGYTDRRVVLDPAHAAKVVPGNNGMFMSTLVLDGRIEGTWKRTIKKKVVEISISPFRPLTPHEQAGVEAKAERYGAYLGLPVAMIS